MSDIRIELPALSRGLLDRSEDIRAPDRVAAHWPSAKVLSVEPPGRLPLITRVDGTHLVLRDAAEWGASPPVGAVLLGRIGDRHYWAIAAAGPGTASSHRETTDSRTAAREPNSPVFYGTIRSAGPLLADDEAALATTAVALLGWHGAARFCSRCGQPSVPDVTGHSRTCPAGHQEFPRTDPAVIVLVHDGADNAILARQPSWTPGRFSVLAGFAEAGESLEGTVVREIGEEIGVRVMDVEYLGSQPWPFPRSLMIAFAARAPRGAALRPRPGEIEQARWFSRRQLRALLAMGDETHGIGPDEGRLIAADADRATTALGPTGQAGAVTLPGSVSIARRMVEGFVRAE